MVISRFREQYVDALSVYPAGNRKVAGLDICTDGDCRFDQDIGGQSWTSYPPHHMDGFETTHPKLAKAGAGGIGFPADISCTIIWKRGSCRDWSGLSDAAKCTTPRSGRPLSV